MAMTLSINNKLTVPFFYQFFTELPSIITFPSLISCYHEDGYARDVVCFNVQETARWLSDKEKKHYGS